VKLDSEGRERTFTAEEFRALLRHTDSLFRQVLLFLRLTGIRPGELLRLTWNQVDFDNHVLVIRKHKSRRTAKLKKPRIVQLPPLAENLLRWRLQSNGRTERVFLNEDGRPWRYNALRCRMRRLRVRAGMGPTRTANESFCTQPGIRSAARQLRPGYRIAASPTS
jgi:integrase